MAIHHNTVKKAAKFGLGIAEKDGQFLVYTLAETDRKALKIASDPKDALDLALLELQPKKQAAPKDGVKTKKRKPARKAKRSDDDGEEESEDDSDEGNSRSIVKSKYREKYRPHKMTNGDAIAKRVRETFMTLKDEDTKKPRLDFERFVKFAKENECWVESYRSLKDRHGNRNNGLIRMNVINRLRAKVRAKQEIVWPK